MQITSLWGRNPASEYYDSTKSNWYTRHVFFKVKKKGPSRQMQKKLKWQTASPTQMWPCKWLLMVTVKMKRNWSWIWVSSKSELACSGRKTGHSFILSDEHCNTITSRETTEHHAGKNVTVERAMKWGYDKWMGLNI